MHLIRSRSSMHKGSCDQFNSVDLSQVELIFVQFKNNRLCGDRGLKTLMDVFKDVKFKDSNSEV
jgi:hypothetical protein